MDHQVVASEKSMPSFISHKLVWGLRIAEVEKIPDGGVILHFTDKGFGNLKLNTSQLANKLEPKAGMYYVRYENSYFSFSPADVFEAGYSPLIPRFTAIEVVEAALRLLYERADSKPRESAEFLIGWLHNHNFMILDVRDYNYRQSVSKK